jgi:uncharacterized protein YciI
MAEVTSGTASSIANKWVGSALLVQRGDRAAVEAMLAGAPYVRAGLYASVEIHDWQFGGRHQG